MRCKIPDKRIKFARIARGHDHAVIVMARVGFQQFDIALADMGVGAKIQIDAHPDHPVCRSPNALPERVEKGSNLARQSNGDAQMAIQLEASGYNVRPVVKLLGHFEDLRAGGGADARPVVERAIDSANRDPQRLRDLLDTGAAWVSFASHVLLFGCTAILVHLNGAPHCDLSRVLEGRLYSLTGIYVVGYIREVESVFEVIAEPNRRAILGLLVSSQQSVGEIERRLRMSQPTVSKHLRVLREAGFVESTVDAQRRLYRLRPEPLQEVDAWLAPFRRFWSAHVDALERHLDRMAHSTADENARRMKRKTK